MERWQAAWLKMRVRLLQGAHGLCLPLCLLPEYAACRLAVAGARSHATAQEEESKDGCHWRALSRSSCCRWHCGTQWGCFRLWLVPVLGAAVAVDTLAAGGSAVAAAIVLCTAPESADLKFVAAGPVPDVKMVLWTLRPDPYLLPLQPGGPARDACQ
eukprot:1141553-Pelagomonas_calceolata.AAC.2